ncbi:chromatin assembly factor 1 subunit A isoform X3 [Onthophagus taurus]|uniref:chromatin assembly factor 1 subunit A isoform X3 n=1 Tax=Onthophagus taurus TaxID=166361 RepID=UPI000C203A45|nr:chromatin assembly factor 1 subunit A isoform X2 [Onthophagus taurus]
MFGLLYAEYVQGSALRTWNCVLRIANTVWYKFNHLRDPIMPRSRRRHHSRSRSRSRSHSHDRDREPKRRKVDSYDSPHHRRSVSSEPEDQTDNISKLDDTQPSESDVSMATADEKETPKKTPLSKPRHSGKLTPVQIEKKKEAEKKRQERIEALEKKKELKEIKEQQKLREKEEKQKEKEKMLREKEEKKKEKEIKKKEKEEKDELRRKEKEQEKIEKQQKIDEKNKEKQKLEEAKLKAAAAFTKFFTKRPENENDKLDNNTPLVKGSINFMPFEIKADMKLAPLTRSEISMNERNDLDELIKNQNTKNLYLNELKNKQPRTFGKTWPKLDDSDDVVVIGETVEEEKQKIKKIRAKYFLFNENQRPAYYGTFRKSSKSIRPKKPFNKDEQLFDYEVDSDEEWEEEPEGESLKGTDDEDEEKESEGNEANDDYLVDNEFFVPHGHLSEDEIDDEAEKLDPEIHKAKLQLLKNEFEEERRLKTLRIRPLVIGSCWDGKSNDTLMKNSIIKYLEPYSLIISDEKIEIQDRSTVIVGNVGKRKVKQPLSSEHLPLFLKFVHGRSVKGKELIKMFIEGLEEQGINIHVSRFAVGKQLRKYAEWKNKEEGVKKKCWLVKEEFQKKFDLDLVSSKLGDVSLKAP